MPSGMLGLDIGIHFLKWFNFLFINADGQYFLLFELVGVVGASFDHF